MAGIREFRRDDVPAVADLWLRAYRDRDERAPESLRRYFERIYFENPWVDPGRPSYVYEDESGLVSGFVALFPRPMTFEGHPIRAAVLSTIMVDPRLRGRSIGRRLMERAFAGPQDIVFTDGANDACRNLWLACGGDLCLLYSCNWIKTLRPGAALLDRAAARRALRPIATALRPVAWIADALAIRAPVGPSRLPAVSARGEDAIEAEILACRANTQPGAALAPEYDEDTFTWLLDETARATRRGGLRKVIVKDGGGALLGWYVYFAQPGGASWVMQLGGAQRAIRQVLLHLFDDARRHGAVEVRGQLEPRYVTEMRELRCHFSFDDLGFLVHARDDALLRAVHAGHTSISRLDGEWWMHFADGPWS